MITIEKANGRVLSEKEILMLARYLAIAVPPKSKNKALLPKLEALYSSIKITIRDDAIIFEGGGDSSEIELIDDYHNPER